MTQSLDDLLADALAHLPPPAARRETVTGPAHPPRTQHHTPLESESRFVRFAAWWDERICGKCGHTERTFDGLFEEREWIKENIGGPKHFLSCNVAPLPELMKGAVSYVRYYKRDFCAKCIGAEGWPLAREYRDGEPVRRGQWLIDEQP